MIGFDLSTPVRGWDRRRLDLGVVTRLLWVVGPAAVWALDFARGRFNTYRIYTNVLWNLLAERSLYLPSPERYHDVNLYGPVFGLLVAPFAVLPDALGGLLWNLAMAALLAVAVRRLDLPPARRVLLALLCTPELLISVWSNQFNPAVAALVLLTFADVEEGRDFRAPLWILLGAFVKVYSVVGLVFIVFSRRRWTFVAGCVAWGALLLVLPMAVASPRFVLGSYLDWAATLAHKNAVNVGLGTSQDISLMGLVRRAAGTPIASAWFYAAAIPLLLAPLLRLGQHRHPAFRRLVAASMLLFLVLFSSGSESSTYVVAAIGAGLWLVEAEDPFRPGRLALLVALLAAALAPTDLLSTAVRGVANRHALKALPYAVAWLLACRDLLKADFALRAAGGIGEAGVAARRTAGRAPALEKAGAPLAVMLNKAAR